MSLTEPSKSSTTKTLPNRATTRPTSKAIGRPPKPVTRTSLLVTLKLLRAIHTALQIADQEKLKVQAKTAVSYALAGLTERLGPMADPAWVPAKRQPGRPTTGYRVTSADGTVADYATRAEAAAAYGIAPTSLSVALSKTGRASKKALHCGNPSAITVERLA